MNQRYNRNDILRIRMGEPEGYGVLYVVVNDPASGCRTLPEGGEPAYELSAGGNISPMRIAQKDLEHPAYSVWIKGHWRPVE